MNIKLIKACKELNIGISTAIEYCRKKGIHISSDPNTRIDDDTFQLLAKRFNSDMEMKLEAELLAQEHQDVHIQSLAIDEPQPTMPTPTTDTAPNVDNLLFKTYLNDLDNDSSIHGETSMGINHKKQLVIIYDYIHDEPHYTSEKTIAIMDEEDTRALAQELKVELASLTDELAEKFRSHQFYCSPDEAHYIFSEVLNYIHSVGLRFHLH